MPRDITLAMRADIHDGTVFRIELADRMIPGDTAVRAQSGDDAVLEFGFRVQFYLLPLITICAHAAGFL